MGKKHVKTIIVDDEQHIRALLKTVLQSMKIEIAGEGKNGQEGLDLYKQEKPHITFLDVNMPIMDGKTALQEIKNLNPAACVIMLSSVTSIEIVQECLEMGADNYIRKDTPIKEMKQIIKTTWEDHIAFLQSDKKTEQPPEKS